MNLLEAAQRDLDFAQRDHHKALTAERAARAKLQAAERRLADLQFKGVEMEIELEALRRRRV